MMKRILTLAVVMMLGITVNAQIDFGIRAGANFTDMNLKDFGNAQLYDDLSNGGRGVGYHAGVYLKLKLLILKIQPELLYTRVQGSLEATDALTGNKVTEDLGVNRFDIPLLAVFGIGPVRLGLGPVYSYQFSSVGDVFEDDGLNSSAWNAQLLAGLEIGKIQVDLRYEFGLSSSLDYLGFDSANSNTVDVTSRPDQIILALGYELF